MPFLLVGIGDIAYTALLFLLAAAVGTLTAVILRHVPNPSIFGAHPLSFIPDALHAITDDLQNASDSSLHRLHDLIVDIGYIDNLIVSDIVHAIDHALRHVAYLYNTTIPSAASDVQQFASDIVGSLRQDVSTDVSVINAGVQGVRDGISHFENYVNNQLAPSIEQDISQAASNALNTAEDYASQATHDLAAQMTAALGGVWSAISTLQTAVTQTLPDEIQRQAASDAAALQSGLQSVYADISNVTNALTGQITSVSQQDASALSNALDNVNNKITSLGSSLTTNLQQAVSNLSNTITTTAGQVTAYAQTQLDTAVGGVQQEITTLQQVAQVTLPAVLDTVPATVITVPAAVAALAGSIAGLISEVDNCMVTTCDGPNNISSVLNKLWNGITDVGELGFLAAAIKDPQGTAGGLEAVWDGVFSAAHDTFDALLSL
jgi:hypothetical protein